MKLEALTCIFFIQLLTTASASNNIGYDAILAIVIAELVFAFSVGVVCIIFSFNLFRTLKESSEVYNNLPIGDLPARNANMKNGANNADPYDYSTFQERETYSFGSEAELDYEGRADGGEMEEGKEGEADGFGGVVNTFTSYLKFW